MAQWLVHEIVECDTRNPGTETRSYRVVAADDPETWVVQTNAALEPETQRHFATLIAEFLSSFLGV